MNWIQKIFSTSHNTQVNGNDTLDISEATFLNNEPPVSEADDQPTRTNYVAEFLERDFAYMGRRDGYEYHSSDLLAINIKRIKSDFRISLDNEIDTRAQMMQRLKEDQLQAGLFSEKLLAQTEAQILRLEQTIQRYELEKKLSVDDEGWVMKAVYEYRDGFIRGYEDYKQEKDLGLEMGLFN